MPPVPELFLELFSEEIPARMQARGAEELERLVREALAALAPSAPRLWFGPRRLALALEVAAAVPEARVSERGPRTSAPEQALTGFLRKHAASRAQLVAEGDYFVLHRETPALDAATLVAQALPGVLRRFAWPKSMRWGTSAFTWVRPLRRILCLLDGETVRFGLAEPADDGHGLVAANLTEGHRFHAPGPVAVTGAADWEHRLRERRVVADPAERRRMVEAGIAAAAAAEGLTVLPDPGLLDEVAGLVEWPVALTGRIDAAFMDLPPEVMRVSMRVNQRYFALLDRNGEAAPRFAFVANIAATDGGAAIVAGNERVLRARFADARHFWDLDRRQPLAARVARLDGVVFHEALGSQGDRVRRLERLAATLAPRVGADPAAAIRAARLAKADLVTGMVGEFPELQGVMGRYYALHDGEPPAIADAIRDHYAPRGPSDLVPAQPVAVAAALADKLDQLAAFFAIGEAPTGSGDPFGLRRAALGVIRIILDPRNALRLKLRDLLAAAGEGLPAAVPLDALLGFIKERLFLQLRADGQRHDILRAVFTDPAEDDLVRLVARFEATAALIAGTHGADLLAAYRRAANILRIEEKKDGAFAGPPDAALLHLPEERHLAAVLDRSGPAIAAHLAAEEFGAAMAQMAALRDPLDAFFEKVTVNADEPELRRNRLRLLARVRDTMNLAADFSRIES
jgi:glycyl-tRNA synthetase beta chain